MGTMTTHEYLQHTRLAARHTQLTIGRFIKNQTRWNARIGDVISRFTGKAAESSSRLTSKAAGSSSRLISNAAGASSRFLRSLALARRFYPALPVSESTAVLAPDYDCFDPLVVRSVPRKLHALIRLRVTIRLGAAYMATQNAITCQHEGWNADQVTAATVGYSATAFSEVERLVLRFTDDLTRTPMDVDLATLRQLHTHFANDQVIELAASITQENYRARFRTALELAAARTAN